MEVVIAPAKEVVIFAERKKTIDKITINEMVDNPMRKTVVAHTRELGAVMLWQGDEYVAIGQWTDAQVQARLLEIYGS